MRASAFPGLSMSGCGLLNFPASLSKYSPDRVANSSSKAMRRKISPPMVMSLPAIPKPSFTILLA
eukprot:5079077-Amphidinium_carterae.1